MIDEGRVGSLWDGTGINTGVRHCSDYNPGLNKNEGKLFTKDSRILLVL